MRTKNEERKADGLLKVGDLARRTGKTVRTIRYYEELGLLHPVSHTKGGFRLFAPDAIGKIELIGKFHALGFSLEEIAAIVSAYRCSPSGDEAANRLKPLLRQSLQTIEQKMALLDRFRREVVGALQFVDDCFRCPEEPEEQRCTSCCRGSHGKADMPSLIHTLVK
jgi:MerR family copper efflux transcriptional regulator